MMAGYGLTSLSDTPLQATTLSSAQLQDETVKQHAEAKERSTLGTLETGWFLLSSSAEGDLVEKLDIGCATKSDNSLKAHRARSLLVRTGLLAVLSKGK